MYQRVRRRTNWFYTLIAILITNITITEEKSIIDETHTKNSKQDILNNDIIDFESAYDLKYNKRYSSVNYNIEKDSNKYTLSKKNKNNDKYLSTQVNNPFTTELSVIPLELLSTTENPYTDVTITDIDLDLTVIPLSTTSRIPVINISEMITVPSSTQNIDKATENIPAEIIEDPTSIIPDVLSVSTTEKIKHNITPIDNVKQSSNREVSVDVKDDNRTNLSTERNKEIDVISSFDTVTKLPSDKREANTENTTQLKNLDIYLYNSKNNESDSKEKNLKYEKEIVVNTSTTIKSVDIIETTSVNKQETNSNDFSTNPPNTSDMDIKVRKENKAKDSFNRTGTEKLNKTKPKNETLDEKDVPLFTELDIEETEVPEDYYDSKDIIPTKPPNTDALSMIFGFAGSVVESVAEKVVPKGIFDLFKRMQKQNEALEAERLRSREENGGIGQFGRGILKSISSGLSKPLNQLMAGVRDIGSLDSDRGFVSGVASGVSSVANAANSVVDSFKNRVQAIYPGTLWCGDGHSAQARSSDLGLFFFTDTCCRQHDACKIYIKAGETKHGLTNTGLFTRSHCGCDAMFRECLRKTNSLISSQIGITYFNVLGPQCFRKAHPIVKCIRRTRITGQKCEEYELDYTKPKMWQWFDSETF